MKNPMMERNILFIRANKGAPFVPERGARRGGPAADRLLSSLHFTSLHCIKVLLWILWSPVVGGVLGCSPADVIPAATLLLLAGLTALGLVAGTVPFASAVAALAGLGLPVAIRLREGPDPRPLRSVKAMLFLGILLPTVTELSLRTEPGRLLLLPVGVQHATTTFLLTVAWAVSLRRSGFQAIYNLVVVGALSGLLGGVPAWLFSSRGIGSPAWGVALCRGTLVGLGLFLITLPDRRRVTSSTLRASRRDDERLPPSPTVAETHTDIESGDTTDG